MKLWKPAKKADEIDKAAGIKKKTKAGLKHIDGKYCVYHHGLGVFKHDCGALLCRECLRDYGNCPHCDTKIDLSKKKSAIRAKKDAPRPAPGISRPQRQPSGSPTFSKPPLISPPPAPLRQPAPKYADSPVSDRKDGASPSLPVKIGERGIIPAPKEKAMPAVEKARGGDESGDEREPGDDSGAGAEIFDDDLDARKRKAFVPSYKRRGHAKLQPGQKDDEDDDDEKDKKKWDVRTVPPVQKKREYESL